jgi:hypothetical protein
MWPFGWPVVVSWLTPRAAGPRRTMSSGPLGGEAAGPPGPYGGPLPCRAGPIVVRKRAAGRLHGQEALSGQDVDNNLKLPDYGTLSTWK